MLTRIFGDRPFVAVAKVLALSLLVGLALTAIGIDPLHLVEACNGSCPGPLISGPPRFTGGGTAFYWGPCSSSRA
jgi:hypothetical protein